MNDTELRELDAWIAGHLFNWKATYAVEKGGLFYRPGSHGYTSSIYEAGHYSKEDAERELVNGESMSIVPHERPKYTTDPAAAIQVLEKCVAELSRREIPAAGKDDFPTQFSIMIRGGYENKKGFVLRELTTWFDAYSVGGIGMAETLPLAICLFAKQLFSK